MIGPDLFDQPAHDFAGHEERVPASIYAIVRDATTRRLNWIGPLIATDATS